MKTKELLEKNPLATEVIRTWFFNQMIASLSDETVPEEFKEMMKQEGVTNERMATFIDVQPRTLFDVFDENKIFICISVWTKTPGHFENAEFGIALNATNKNNSNFSSRKEAEIFAIEKAFELLEEKLKPIDLPASEE
jgi:small-conductance mechanosensitive channel